MFVNILTLDNHLRCGFTIDIKEMLEDDIDVLLNGVVIMIA